MYNLAIQGDEEARKIFRRVGRALGIWLANMVNAFNLPMYVIGGGVSSAWEAFSPAMFEELRQRSMVYAATTPDPHSLAGRALPRKWGQMLDEDDYHSGIAGQRCGTVRRGAIADGERLRDLHAFLSAFKRASF